MKNLVRISLVCFVTLLNAQQIVDTTKIFGVTIDDPWGDRSALIEAFSAHCRKPTARIVFDEGVAASEYETPVSELKPYCFIMGEILDSYYVKAYSVRQYLDRTTEYLDRFEEDVSIWEVGNEVNGEWLGETDSVVQKIEGAYSIVAGRGKTTALTFYYNKACYENPQNEMFTWINENVSDSLRQNLDYVLVSYYEDDCENTVLTNSEWQAVFDSLHTLFPNSKLGMGECGTQIPSKKAAYMHRYYGMELSTPGYIRGYFWWYYKQDCVPASKALWDTLDTIVSKWESPASVSENESERPFEIKIFPNPTNGAIHIYPASVTKVEIYNLLGERVKVFYDMKNVDISDQPKGVFFLRIATASGWQTRKIIHLTGK